jgi:hypothetical protein
MKLKNNIGEVGTLDLQSVWRFFPDDKPVPENEFDSATSEIESFFEGLKYSYGHCEFIVIGNFHGERTHHVIIKGAALGDNGPLSDILKKWLSVSRRKNWRIIADFECDDTSNRSIIYCSEIFRI